MPNINKKNWQYYFGFLQKNPIYFFVFIVHLPLSLYNVYSVFYSAIGLLPAIALSLLIGTALFAVLKIWIADVQVAGLVALIAFAILFPASAFIAPVYPVIALFGAILIIRAWLKRRKEAHPDTLHLPEKFTPVANFVAMVMLIAIGGYSVITSYRVTLDAEDIVRNTSAAIKPDGIAAPKKPLPHIVHIVLDGYSRADALQDAYGFDNSQFLGELKKRGFRISDRATSPYNQTLFVMSSIFSLGRITNALTAPPERQDMTHLRRTLARVHQYGTVPQILRSLRYELVSTPTSYFPVQWDKVVPVDGAPFETNRLRLDSTYNFASDLLESSPILEYLAKTFFNLPFSIESINYQVLKEVPLRQFKPSGSDPLFIYQHILAPHPPFNIAADGAPRESNELGGGAADGSHLIFDNERHRTLYRDGYIEKLRYINGAILEQIDSIKKSLSGPLIIILHGDHGGGLHFDHDDKSETCLSERFSPLLTVYATDDAVSNAFTPDFNIVNIYRAIFRTQFGLTLPDLPDQNTFISWSLDTSVDLHPSELAVSCSAADRPRIADNPDTPSAPGKGSVSR